MVHVQDFDSRSQLSEKIQQFCRPRGFESDGRRFEQPNLGNLFSYRLRLPFSFSNHGLVSGNCFN